VLGNVTISQIKASFTPDVLENVLKEISEHHEKIDIEENSVIVSKEQLYDKITSFSQDFSYSDDKDKEKDSTNIAKGGEKNLIQIKSDIPKENWEIAKLQIPNTEKIATTPDENEKFEVEGKCYLCGKLTKVYKFYEKRICFDCFSKNDKTCSQISEKSDENEQ